MNTELLKIITNSIEDVNATNIEIIDMENQSPLFDHMVICTATNERQLKAIVEHAVKAVEESGYTVKNVEGKNGNIWILVDFVDVILHVFTESERQNYNIEKLWGEYKRIDSSDFIE